MNWAKAEPCVRIIKPPSKSKNINIGASHHFFLTLRKSHSSDMIDNLLISYSLMINSELVSESLL